VANLTRSQLVDRVLEHLGVKAADQAAKPKDAEIVGEAADAAHDRLKKFGLAPFLLTAIPPWAQVHLRDYVAGDVAQMFGLGAERLAEFKGGAIAAERELARQVSLDKQSTRIQADYF
jgi:hypothetical protein